MFEEMPEPDMVIPTPKAPKMGVVAELATTVSVLPEMEPNMDGVVDSLKVVQPDPVGVVDSKYMPSEVAYVVMVKIAAMCVP